MQPAWSSLLVFVLVLAAIPLSAWLLQRRRVFGARNTGVFSVEGGILVGARERIALVRADQKWLVVGITPQSITLLTELDGPPAMAAASDAARAGEPFQDLLGRFKRSGRDHG